MRTQAVAFKILKQTQAPDQQTERVPVLQLTLNRSLLLLTATAAQQQQ